MNLQGASVLVTGGAGFIGSHVTEQLVGRGARVTVLDDMSAGRLKNLAAVLPDIEMVTGSVADAPLVSRLVSAKTVVFNFAANADVPRSVSDPQLDFTSNAIGTFNLLTACRQHGVERVLQASTAAVYGEPLLTPMSEEHQLRPISPYGASKLAAESLGLAYHHTYDLPFTAVRIFNTYGPRQPRYVIHDLFRKLERDSRRLEVLGTGEQVRDYCYVDDTARAFCDLCERDDAVGRVYNIAGGTPLSIRELVALILECLGLHDTTVHYTGVSWPGDITRLVADITRIRATGFAPTVDMPTGLARFRDWLQSNDAKME